MYSFPLHCNRSRLPTPGPIVNSNLGALCPLIPLLPLLLPHRPEEAYPRATNTCPTVPHTAKSRPWEHLNPPQTIHQRMDLGGIDTPPSPNCDTVHEVENWSPAQILPKPFQGFGSVLPRPPPRPPILASLAKNNFSQAYRLAFVINYNQSINISINIYIYISIYLSIFLSIYLSIYSYSYSYSYSINIPLYSCSYIPTPPTSQYRPQSHRPKYE